VASCKVFALLGSSTDNVGVIVLKEAAIALNATIEDAGIDTLEGL
jgi:hypothetical protein